MDSSGLTIE
jgi:hypothetical protein